MKNDRIVCFPVRLDLGKPTHARAWEILCSSGLSRPAAIVEALINQEKQRTTFPDADLLKQIVREAVAEALGARTSLPTLAPAFTEIESHGEISDEDFDVADDFISILCGET